MTYDRIIADVPPGRDGTPERFLQEGSMMIEVPRTRVRFR